MVRKILRNNQWDRIKHLLPGKPGDKGATAADNRLFIEAVMWLLRTGSGGRAIYGPGEGVAVGAIFCATVALYCTAQALRRSR